MGNSPAPPRRALGVIHTALIGRRQTQEDRHVTIESLPEFPELAVFSVFDGHNGDQCAHYCSENMHKEIQKQIKRKKGRLSQKCIRRAFTEVDAEFLSICELAPMDSGCTAVVCVLNRATGQMVTGNAGDARAVLSRGGTAKGLTIDHKPALDEEKKRIEAAGRRVVDNRLDGCLAVSRAIGDLSLKFTNEEAQGRHRESIVRNGPYPVEAMALTSYPYVSEEVLNEDDEFLVLACDGLFDVMTNQQVVDWIRDRIYQTLEAMASEPTASEAAAGADGADGGAGADDDDIVDPESDKALFPGVYPPQGVDQSGVQMSRRSAVRGRGPPSPEEEALQHAAPIVPMVVISEEAGPSDTDAASSSSSSSTVTVSVTDSSDATTVHFGAPPPSTSSSSSTSTTDASLSHVPPMSPNNGPRPPALEAPPIGHVRFTSVDDASSDEEEDSVPPAATIANKAAVPSDAVLAQQLAAEAERDGWETYDLDRQVAYSIVNTPNPVVSPFAPPPSTPVSTSKPSSSALQVPSSPSGTLILPPATSPLAVEHAAATTIPITSEPDGRERQSTELPPAVPDGGMGGIAGGPPPLPDLLPALPPAVPTSSSSPTPPLSPSVSVSSPPPVPPPTPATTLSPSSTSTSAAAARPHRVSDSLELPPAVVGVGGGPPPIPESSSAVSLPPPLSDGAGRSALSQSQLPPALPSPDMSPSASTEQLSSANGSGASSTASSASTFLAVPAANAGAAAAGANNNGQQRPSASLADSNTGGADDITSMSSVSDDQEESEDEGSKPSPADAAAAHDAAPISADAAAAKAAAKEAAKQAKKDAKAKKKAEKKAAKMEAIRKKRAEEERKRKEKEKARQEKLLAKASSGAKPDKNKYKTQHIKLTEEEKRQMKGGGGGGGNQQNGTSSSPQMERYGSSDEAHAAEQKQKPISSKDIIRFYQYCQRKQYNLAEDLGRFAIRRGSMDNISIIIVFLGDKQDPAVLATRGPTIMGSNPDARASVIQHRRVQTHGGHGGGGAPAPRKKEHMV